MAERIEPGTKVKYLHGGEWKQGIIHGYRTYERESGIIRAVTYLIDTGKSVREDITKTNAKGEPVEVFRQPEQIEVDQRMVKVV